MITDSDIVLRAYQAYIDADTADLAPDVERVEPEEYPHGGARHGPAEVAEYLRLSRARGAELVSEPTAHRPGCDIVVGHHAHGRLVDGTTAEAPVADVYTAREGLVVRVRAYADPAAVLPRW
jgi:ketosteroid isomerase-like protein